MSMTAAFSALGDKSQNQENKSPSNKNFKSLFGQILGGINEDQ